MAHPHQPSSDFSLLEWQKLGSALARQDFASAKDHLDAIIRDKPEERSLVEQGFYGHSISRLHMGVFS